MKEEEIIETFKHWIKYEKANKDKINKADELIEIQQGLLDLYEKEKEKNKELEELLEEKTIRIGFENQDNYISKDKIREKIKHKEDLILQIENYTLLKNQTEKEKNELQILETEIKAYKDLLEEG